MSTEEEITNTTAPIEEETTNEVEAPAVETSNEPEHPLQNTWKFWTILQTKDKTYSNNVKDFDEFNTVEKFWDNFLSLPKPSLLLNDNSKATYSSKEIKGICIFKSDLAPQWEDEVNKNGSEFVFNIPNLNPEHLNSIWELICLTLIGEGLESDNSSEICGSRLVKQKKAKGSFKFEFWLKSNDPALAQSLFKKVCDLIKQEINIEVNESTYTFSLHHE